MIRIKKIMEMLKGNLSVRDRNKLQLQFEVLAFINMHSYFIGNEYISISHVELCQEMPKQRR